MKENAEITRRGGFLSLRAFTLAEVLITLGIIGVVAALTIPTLIQKQQEKAWVTGLLEFNSLIHQSVKSWRADVGCNESMDYCLGANIVQSCPDGSRCTINDSALDVLVENIKITDKACSSDCAKTVNTVSWLPVQTYLYSGANQSTSNWQATNGGVSQSSTSMRAYLLANGMTMTMSYEYYQGLGFIHVFVDVNGLKPPNRMGKDTFPFTIGEIDGAKTRSGNDDVIPYPRDSSGNAADGMCGPFSGTCDPNNVDPSVGLGASPTAYAILNHKIADFTALSKTVAGFKP